MSEVLWRGREGREPARKDAEEGKSSPTPRRVCKPEGTRQKESIGEEMERA